MKHFQLLTITLWLLLVPFTHGQLRTTSAPKVSPMLRTKSFSSRNAVPTIPSTTARTTRGPVAQVRQTGNAVLAPDNDAKIKHSVADFTMQLSRTLWNRHSKTELFSPISIVTVANLLFLGSGGITHEEFGKVLTPHGMNYRQLHTRYGRVLANLKSPQPVVSWQDPWRRQTCPDDYEFEDGQSKPSSVSQVIRIANGIFYHKNFPIRPQYLKLASDIYSAKAIPIDPQNPIASTAVINKWVSDETAGKITQMLDGKLSPSSSVIIANALYFKAKWKTQFEPLVTRDAPFFPDGYYGPSYSVKMMTLSGCLPFHKTRDAMQVSIVGLPYLDDISTMYLLQPINSTRTAIRRLQSVLTGKLIDSWIGQMKLQSTTVRLPRMHLKNSIDLLKSFQDMGFNSITSAAKSNLSNMVNSTLTRQKPYVNQILHKLDLLIDEEGTEGAAATSALVDRISSQKSFNGNAPFIVYLRHDPTGLPLFYGPIFDPR